MASGWGLPKFIRDLGSRMAAMGVEEIDLQPTPTPYIRDPRKRYYPSREPRIRALRRKPGPGPRMRLFASELEAEEDKLLAERTNSKWPPTDIPNAPIVDQPPPQGKGGFRAPATWAQRRARKSFRYIIQGIGEIRDHLCNVDRYRREGTLCVQYIGSVLELIMFQWCFVRSLPFMDCWDEKPIFRLIDQELPNALINVLTLNQNNASVDEIVGSLHNVDEVCENLMDDLDFLMREGMYNYLYVEPMLPCKFTSIPKPGTTWPAHIDIPLAPPIVCRNARGQRARSSLDQIVSRNNIRGILRGVENHGAVPLDESLTQITTSWNILRMHPDLKPLIGQPDHPLNQVINGQMRNMQKECHNNAIDPMAKMSIVASLRNYIMLRILQGVENLMCDTLFAFLNLKPDSFGDYHPSVYMDVEDQEASGHVFEGVDQHNYLTYRTGSRSGRSSRSSRSSQGSRESRESHGSASDSGAL